MLFFNQKTKETMIIQKSVSVFEENSQVEVVIYDEYIQITSSMHNMNLFYQHIAECNLIETGMEIIYYNAKKERKNIILQNTKGSCSKIVKAIKKKM